MRELAALAETAGAVVVDGLLQRRPHPDPSTYLGRGKVEELRGIVGKATGADTVVADTELAPSQRPALEDAVKVKVIGGGDPRHLQPAREVREGKAQVELAQARCPAAASARLGRVDVPANRRGQVGASGAGMGSRGPGETKIELDRRHPLPGWRSCAGG